MGQLVDGTWKDEWYDTKSTGGKFKRSEARFRDRPAPAAKRYHLYVSYACPWAHRTLIVRKLKKLEDVISVSVVEAHMGKDGWVFASPEPLNGKTKLYELYLQADPHYSGRATVPVLWDKERATIVNNESAEIIRILNSDFDAWADRSVDLYPASLRAKIDEVNAFVYDDINNGVYKAGFATTQEAYEEAFTKVFNALDRVEKILGEHRFLAGDRLSEADIRLFTTLVRFDAVYVGHFKCNLRRIEDYPHLSRLLEDIYRMDGVAETVHMDHIKRHYYTSHPTINPTGIIPSGPALRWLNAGAEQPRPRTPISPS